MTTVRIAWTRRSSETPNPTVTGPYLVRSEQCEHREEDPYVAYYNAEDNIWAKYPGGSANSLIGRPSHWIWIGG